MTVRQLMKRLADLDPDAQVLLMLQPNWPFENSVLGVVTREEISSAEDDPPAYAKGTAGSDVFLVEGSQLRYGAKKAWEVAE